MKANVTTTFDELERNECSSVTDYCRLLMKLNPDRYGGMGIHVYRGEMLCLIGDSVAKCAQIEPDGADFRKYRPDKDLKVLQWVGEPRVCV